MDEGVKNCFMSLSQELFKKFSKNIYNNISLANFSWFNLGGPAEFFFKPENKKQLLDFLKENKKNKLKITIIGAGSNTLIRDKGVKGVVIKLGSSFSKISLVDNTTIEVGAATLDRKVSMFAKENKIGDMEFLSCIPGSIGGAVVMNSGCYGGEISKILHSIKIIDIKKCIEKEIGVNDIKFFYRGTSLPSNIIITSVKIKGKSSSKQSIEKIQNDMIERKKLSQPNQIKTCGSTFKNLSEQKKAWQVIKETGSDKFKVGDAIISDKHCNFFVNNGNAKSSDIEDLIKKVKKEVYNKLGVDLELEIKIIGE